MADECARKELSRKAIRQWLSEPAGQQLLKKVAVATRRRLDFGKYRVSISGSGASDDSPDRKDSLISELKSELCLFLMEKADRIEPLILCETANPDAYIYSSFINHLKENTRKRSTDAGRYLYKRATSIFSKAKPAISVKKTKKSSAFSRRPAPENRIIPSLADDDLTAIPFPVDQVQRLDFDAVNHRTVLLTHRGAGYLRFLIIGLIPDTDPGSLWPNWADNLMDASAKKGLLRAAAATTAIHPLPKGQSLFTYP